MKYHCEPSMVPNTSAAKVRIFLNCSQLTTKIPSPNQCAMYRRRLQRKVAALGVGKLPCSWESHVTQLYFLRQKEKSSFIYYLLGRGAGLGGFLESFLEIKRERLNYYNPPYIYSFRIYLQTWAGAAAAFLQPWGKIQAKCRHNPDIT